MRTWLVGGTRFVFVVVGIIVLTSFTIDATDALRGSQSALSILARSATEAGCPAGTVLFEHGETRLCVDVYEAGVGGECPVSRPQNVADTITNSNAANCVPVSQPGVAPWQYVAPVQAEALCAKAGKRLLSPTEWYQVALGTPGGNNLCNTNGELASTGAFAECRSGAGAYDMVGNVWEVVQGAVTNRQYGEQTLPESGYVSAIYDSGLAAQTTSTPQAIYDNAYFWSEDEGLMAIMRGGFYGSRSDASVYTTYAKIDQSFASAALGFRCARDL